VIRRHLTDAQLIDASIGHAASDEHAQQCIEHVEHCGECRTRHESMRAMMADASSAATAEAEAAFPVERLTRQYDRIMERVEQMSRAGRVISFPAAFDRVTPPSAANGSRWVAAAAAAGLVVGLLGGHLTHDLRVQPSSGMPGRTPATTARAAIVPVTQPAEDDLLGQVEVAFEGRGPSALRPLDALTPVAWDVRE
jgi:anti-sigma factor RsiW